MHNCDPSNQETEAEDHQIEASLELCSEASASKNKTTAQETQLRYEKHQLHNHDNQSSNPSTNITKPVLQQSVTPAPKDLIHILLISPGVFSYTNIPIKIKSLKNPI